MLEDFKKFRARGNVVDLAIGVIIGAAFGAIVNSLVGRHHHADRRRRHRRASTSPTTSSRSRPRSRRPTLAEAKKQGAVLAWGNFITLVINFIIIAWVLFMIIRGMSKLVRKEEAEARAALEVRKSCSRKSADLLKARPPIS